MRASSSPRAHDVLRAALDLAGEVLHRVGDDAEAAPRFTGALRLDTRVECDQARLQRDLRDLAGGSGHLAQRVDDARDLVAHRLHRHACARHACRLFCVCTLMPSCAFVICCSCCASTSSACAWRADTACVSTISPRTSAASRPRVEACRAIDCTAARPSICGAAADGAAACATVLLFLKSVSTGGSFDSTAHQSRNFMRSRAIDWLCNWHTRLSVTFSTAAISFRFMSCS